LQVLDLVENWDRGLETRLFMSAGVRLSAEPTKPPSRLPLTTLISVAEHVRIQSLETATRLCPEARAVTLSNAWLPNTALYKLMVMEHLTSLSLTNCEGLTLDFHEGVLPLLAVCGERLQNLILANFTFVDIAGKLQIYYHYNCLRRLTTYSLHKQINMIKTDELLSSFTHKITYSNRMR
jgi:hypothetical protein